MKPTLPLAAGLAGLVLAAGGAVPDALAHHGAARDYDITTEILLKGRVNGVEWINPHTRLHLTVSEAGKDQRWLVEAGTPNTLMRGGVTRETVAAGVDITVRGFRSKDGRCEPECRAYGREITFPDGRKIFLGTTFGNLQTRGP